MPVLADNSYDLVIAVITTIGAVLVALIPAMVLIVRNHRQGERIYRHINSVEEEVATDGEPSLGQLVRDGFRRNDEDHALIVGRLSAIGDLAHSNASRLDDQRAELDALAAQLRPSRQRAPASDTVKPSPRRRKEPS